MNFFKKILLIIIVINISICIGIFYYKQKIIISNPEFAKIFNKILKNTGTDNFFNTDIQDITFFNGKPTIFNIYNIDTLDYLKNFKIIKELEENNLNVNVIDVVIENKQRNENRLIELAKYSNIYDFILKNHINRPLYVISRKKLQKYLNIEDQTLIITDFNIDKSYYLYKHNMNYRNVLKQLNKIHKKTKYTRKFNPNHCKQNNNDELFIKSLNRIEYIENYKNIPAFLITDTIGKQIFITNINGKIINIIGNGNKDTGNINEISFCSPIVSKFKNNKIYVVDSCDNAIKEIDLENNTTKYLIKDINILQNIKDFEFIDENNLILSTENKVFKINVLTKNIENFDNIKNVNKITKYNNKIYLFDTHSAVLYYYDNATNPLYNLNDFLNLDYKVIKNFYVNSMGIYFLDSLNKTVFLINKNNDLEKKEIKNGNDLYDLIFFKNYLYITDSNHITQLDLIRGNINEIYLKFNEENKLKLTKQNILHTKTINNNLFKNIEISENVKNLIIKFNENNYEIINEAPNYLNLYIKENDNLKLKENIYKIKNKTVFKNIDNLQDYFLIGKIYYKDKQNNIYIKYVYNKIIFTNNLLNNEIEINFYKLFSE